MSIQFPTDLDNFANPIATDRLNSGDPTLKHATQHANANDAIEALEAKVGKDGSAVTTSLDYKTKNGSFIRKTVAATTPSMAAAASETATTIALGKGCTVVKLATDYPAWVRIYSSAAAQTADAARAQNVDPTGEHGLLLEVITTSDNLSLNLAPPAICYSLESSPGANLTMTVKNLDTEARAITVTATIVPFEG